MVVEDKTGVAVAMLAADDAVEIASWRVSEADAVRVIHALIESICCFGTLVAFPPLVS